jgi:hypothetical protein
LPIGTNSPNQHNKHDLEDHATSSAPPHLRTIAFAITALSVVLLFLGETVWVGNLSGDEASHVIMAKNIAHDFDYFARPSLTPLGDLDEKRNVVTIKLVENSFLASALVSASAWGAALFFIYRIARLLGPESVPWTLMLAACSPGLFWMFSWQEAEPTMTAFGLGATWLLTSGHWNRKPLRTVIGGALLGFAVVIKLLLVLPFVAVVGVCIVGRWFDDLPPCRFDIKFIGLAMLGFIPAAGSHLLAVWMMAPQELSFWIRQVYPGIASSLPLFKNRSLTPRCGRFPSWLTTSTNCRPVSTEPA